MATIEKMTKDKKSSGTKHEGQTDLPHGRKGHTEKMAMKQDYSEKGSRSHGKVHKDCY